MKKEIIKFTQDRIIKSLGIPLNSIHTPWRQKGNGNLEWSWHRSGLLSRSNRPPRTHTTRYTINRSADGNYTFEVQTTHAPDELECFLEGLIEGGKKTKVILTKLKKLGFEVIVYCASSNSDESFVISSPEDAKRALKRFNQTSYPWYDTTQKILKKQHYSSKSNWANFLDKALPLLIQIFWLHFFGKNYWKVTSKQKVMSENPAHVNSSLRRELIKIEGEKCQNIQCRKRNTNVQVAHLHPHKNRERLSNVVLLCGTCHNQQKSQSICRAKLRSKKNQLYLVTFDPRNPIRDPNYWTIKSKHELR